VRYAKISFMTVYYVKKIISLNIIFFQKYAIVLFEEIIDT
jgi:hypothetical protein